MATEFYDEEQAKKIYELEETMVLDDQTAYFLVSCENLTRKINLLSLAKALNGDETSENKELKFYSTSYLDNKVKEMYTSINSMGSHFDEYSNIIEKLQTKIDTSMERFQNIVNSIDPKLVELETKLQRYVDEKCKILANEDVLIYKKIDEVYNELKESDNNIRTEINNKFDELFNVIDDNGDISAQMFATLQSSIETINNEIGNLKAEIKNLKEKDTYLENLIRNVQSGASSSLNSYYSAAEIDRRLEEIYRYIRVQVISSTTDSSGRRNDLNNYDTSGLYLFTSTASASNMPDSCVNGILWTINCGNGSSPFIKQVFFRYGTININDQQMYIRSRMSGNWSDWERTLTTKDIIWGTKVPEALENGQIYLQYFT